MRVAADSTTTTTIMARPASQRRTDDELLATPRTRMISAPLSPLRTSFHMAPPSNRHSRTRSISAFSCTPHLPSPLSTSFRGINTSLSAPELEQSDVSGSVSELEDGTQEISLPDRNFAASKPLTPLGQGFTFGSKPPPSLQPTRHPQHSSPPSLSVTRARRGHHHKHSLSHNFFSFLEPGSTSVPFPHDPTPVSDTSEPQLHSQPIPVLVSSWDTKLNTSPAFDNTAHPSIHHPLPLLVSPTLAKALSIINSCLGATLWVRGQQAGSLACTGLGYWVVFDAIGLALSRNFDFGIGSILNRLGGGSVSNDKVRAAIRRPYGAARLSTLLTFAQSVYLMFSAVYVCKETIEHVLLSAGEAQAHHHHPGDESSGAGLQLPLFLTCITFFSLLGSAILFDNNFGLVNITQTRIPPFSALFRTILSSSKSQDSPGTPVPPRSRVTRALTNPFVLSPLVFCIGILLIGNLVSSHHQRLTDLLLASLIALITFNLAYRACVVLGIVLLQTSPARTNGFEKGRSRKEGQMEPFLRTMRELERHPHVLHLPAPHIWQIAPPGSLNSSSSAASNLVVTIQIHVRAELGDEDVLELTRWAWERVVLALGGSLTKKNLDLRELDDDERRREDLDRGRPEVTVGIVRG